MSNSRQLDTGISRAALLYAEHAAISDIREVQGEVVICLSVLKDKKTIKTVHGNVDRATQLSCALREVHPRLASVEVTFVNELPDLEDYMDSLGILGSDRERMRQQISFFTKIRPLFK